MSYSIYIGQAVVGTDDDGEALDVIVQETRDPRAPVAPGDEMTGDRNACHPSDSAWYDFCRATELTRLFLDEERGLMREHPGCFRITVQHLLDVRAALEVYRRRYPDAAPGFGAKPADAHLARLIWLEWWMGHALRTCSLPAIYNH